MINFELSYQWPSRKKSLRALGRSERREYRPDLESFIEAWQHGDSIQGLAESLNEDLQKDPSIVKLRERLQLEDNVVLHAWASSPKSLNSRANYWRSRGVPLQRLRWSLNIENQEEKLQRLAKLARSSQRAKQRERNNG